MSFDSAPETNQNGLASAVVTTTQELPIAVVIVADSQYWHAASVDMFAKERRAIDGIGKRPVRGAVLMRFHDA